MPSLPAARILTMRARCELPERDGAPCPRPAVTVVTIKTKRFEYPFAVCAQCAAYVEKQTRKEPKHANRKTTTARTTTTASTR
jgi:hypothetical protein